MAFYNNVIAGAAGAGEAEAYLIERSCRLDEDTQAHLHRTPTVESNRRTWTVSFWFKRSTPTVSGEDKIWGASVSNNAYTQLYFDNNDKLVFNSSGGYMTTDMHFKDLAAWYHCVLAFDGTQGTDANKAKMYINGRLLSYPSEFSAANLNGLGSNHSSQINTTNKHTISGKQNLSNSHYFDGLIAEVQFIDGQQLSADYFGKYDAKTGEWVPKAYANSTATAVPITAAPTLSNGALIIKGVNNNTLQGIATSQGGNLNFWTSVDGINWSHSGTGQGPNSIGGSSVKYVGMGGAGTSNRTWASSGPDFEYALWNSDTSFDSNTGNPGNVTGLTYLSSPTSNYGTNGYHLDFEDLSTRGKDVSGRENNWTTDNINQFDIFRDSPTIDAENNVGNYATLNGNDSPNNYYGTLTNGALDFVGNTGAYSILRATQPIPAAGKYYYEALFKGNAYNPRNVGSQHTALGFCKTYERISSITDGNSTWLADSGYGTNFGSTRTDWYGADIDQNKVVGVAVNRDANVAFFLVDGELKQALDLGADGFDDLSPFVYSYNNTATSLGCNFGQTDFVHYPVQSSLVTGDSTQAGYNSTKMFDGNLNTYMSHGAFGWTAYWRPYLTGVTSLEVYLQTGSRSEQIIVTGNLGSQTFTYSANTSGSWHTMSLANIGSEVRVVQIGPRGQGGEYIDVGAWRVNGTVVTDSNTPTGFDRIYTGSLPEPGLPDPSTALKVQTYTGTSGEKTITTGFSPDLVWTKNMSQTRWHRLIDSLRGVTKNLYPNEDDAESTNDTNNYKSLDATGYTLFGLDRDTNDGSGDSYVSWAWDGGDLVVNSSSSYNQSETWSNSFTGLGLTDADNAFNGDTSSIAQSPNNASATLMLTHTFTNVTSLRVYASNPTTNEMRLNNTGSFTAESSLGASSNAGWRTLTSLIPANGTVTHIEARTTTGSGVNWAAIEVNGKTLINPGFVPVGSLNDSVYDRSQTWSNMITRGSGWHHSSNYFYQWTLDGNLNNYDHAAANQTATATFSSSFPKGVIELFIGRGGGNNGQLNVNGTNISAAEAPGHNWYRVNGDTLSSYSVTNPAQNVGICAIRVNGKILADPSPSYSITNYPGLATTVTSNPSAGFSISTYSGGNAYGQSFAHGLDGQTPEMVIIKARNNVENWRVYHKGVTDSSQQNFYLILELTTALSGDQGRSIFDRVGPSPYVMHLGNDSAINGSSNDFVAYSFAPVYGFSDFGFYKHDPGDGAFVNCSFRPAWVMIRRTDTANSWVIYDEARDPYNATTRRLYADDINVDHENTSHYIDIFSNGFKIRSPQGNLLNSSDSNARYVWAAFASSPFKTANAR